MVLIKIDVSDSAVFINPDQIVSLRKPADRVLVGMSDGTTYGVMNISIMDFIAQLKNADHHAVTG